MNIKREKISKILSIVSYVFSFIGLDVFFRLIFQVKKFLVDPYLINFLDNFINTDKFPTDKDFFIFAVSALVGLVLSIIGLILSRNKYSIIAIAISVFTVLSIIVGSWLFPLFLYD